MASDIEIASNALVRIGVPPISSFSEGGAAGIAAGNLYEPTTRMLLTESRWRFAAAKRKLARLTATPLNEWEYAFQLPSDLLLMYRVYPNQDYEIYEDKIYSNASEVEVDYLFRPNESLFPAYFQVALEYKLASEFALIVTSNRSLAETYEFKYSEAMKKARYADSQSRPSDAIEVLDYIKVRG
jgi:hypothetical protein